MASENKNQNHDPSKETVKESAFDFRYYLNMPRLSLEEGANIWRPLKDSDAPKDIDRIKEVYARLFVDAMIYVCPRPDDLEILEKMCQGWTLDKIYAYCRGYDMDEGFLESDLISLLVDRREELFKRMFSNEWMLKERCAQIEEMIRSKSGDDVLRMNEDLVSEISEEIGENPENVHEIVYSVRWKTINDQRDRAFWAFVKGADFIEKERKLAVIDKYDSLMGGYKIAVAQYLKVYEDPDGNRESSLPEERVKQLVASVLGARPQKRARLGARLWDYLD